MQSNQNKTTAPCIFCSKFALVILLLLHVHVSSVAAERTCHQCRGINCLRTTYEATQKCLNELDICVTVFDGQTVLAQGCLEQLSEELRNKCGGYAQSQDSEEIRDCFKCNENLCNNLASSSFECIQCDSDSDENCRTNPLSLLPTRCAISRTPNEYCYVKQEGNRVIRGCSSTMEEQNTCLSRDDCMICQPSELSECNANDITLDGSGSGDGGTDNGSGNGGSDEGESGNVGGEAGSENTAERICHQCRGINCLRTTYKATQKCLNDLDICVTVFDGQTILAQGCLEQLSEELRHKCDADTTAQDSLDLSECFKCNDNLCNNLASSSFECIQCDSESDANCRNNPQSLAPSRCGISRTPNEYCFVKQEGERVIRGCSNTLEDQKSCLSSIDCMICQPSELSGCNDMEVITNDSGSGSDSGNGGSDEGESGNGSGGEDGSGNESGNTAERICHQCRGINCLRTTYEATQKCLNDLDICVTVFDGQTILAQGCLEQLSEELRHKCDVDATAQDSLDLSECFKCNDNLCNNLASSSFECIQCDSESDANCRTNPQNFTPSRCAISRTPNEYCFVKQEGERVIRGCSNTLEEQVSCLSSADCMICQPSELSGCNDMEVITNDSGSGSDSGNGGSDEGESGNGSGGEDGSGNESGNTAERICHQCRGINCLRTTYEATQKCLNDLDICVTVFDGQTIIAQGCLEQLPEELRHKCDVDTTDQDSLKLSECFKCNDNLCNNLASSSFECIQCDSESDANCRNNPQNFTPSRCGISRTPNEYCFVKQEGERVIRGCSNTLEEQVSCLSSADCMICQPSELSGCNDMEVLTNDSGSGSGSGDGSGSGSDNGGSDQGESGSGSGGENTGDGGSGNSGSDQGESGSDSGGENTGDGGSGNSGTDQGESGSGSGGENTGDSGSNAGDGGSGDGSADAGSGSGDGGTGNGSDGSGTSSINSHIFIFIINIIIVFFVSK